ncbi:MAG: ATP-dependent Clp protease ATP-binding subunit [Armatimonadetes bacterium]|nr:ATP-dependent Clp protease ATP-binding subunit [Armatimonadota bacterium]
MMWQRFTERARKAVFYAQEEAQRNAEGFVSTEHILLGLLREDENMASNVVARMGVSVDKLRQELEKAMPKGEGKTHSDLSLTPRAKRVIDLAYDEARTLNNNYIGTEHLLLGLVREAEGLAGRTLLKLGIDLETARREIGAAQQEQTESAVSDSAPRPTSSKNKSTSVLDEYSRDLTALARQGKLDPVIGREEEVQRLMQILSRRTKNNPVLVGEPGVGKTAIAEGLAQRIVQSNVPKILADKRLVSLDLAAIVAGTKYRGEFEERLKKLMEEIRRAQGQIIVFIDELHTLIGAGSAEGAIDASNIMKPALARGEMQCIGATTFDEYRKYIERDAALERRFQAVQVKEPSPEVAYEILRGLRDRYEAHHGVEVTDGALRAAVDLSVRYITDRTLPDKGIDLIDEACAKARLLRSMPPPRIGEIRIALIELEREMNRKKRQKKTDEFTAAQTKKAELEQELGELELALESDYEQELTITETEIAAIVQSWTGIPVNKVAQAESERLLSMEEDLHKQVVGQDDAVKALSQTIRRARSGLADPKRPIGSFMFLGPTGVGKTELAKTLSRYLYDKEDAMVRIDMSEYMERFAVSRLVGAPPGYIGYDEGGQLTEAVRRNPYCVVLLDEIEKAHPEVFNILLQVMEDGQLTDSRGRRVDFKNTIIIMTSNVGVKPIELEQGLGFRSNMDDPEDPKTYVRMKKAMLEDMKKMFRPEFLNRIDEVIVFQHLRREDILRIADMYMLRLYKQCADLGITVELTDALKDLLVKEGYDPNLGARPLRRAVQRYVENPLSEQVLHHGVVSGKCYLVDVEEGDEQMKTVVREVECQPVSEA